MILRDVGVLLKHAEMLVDPGSNTTGPRIAGGKTCCIGNDKINFGTVVFKPDHEEYMWLLNLLLLNKVVIKINRLICHQRKEKIRAKHTFVFFLFLTISICLKRIISFTLFDN